MVEQRIPLDQSEQGKEGSSTPEAKAVLNLAHEDDAISTRRDCQHDF